MVALPDDLLDTLFNRRMECDRPTSKTYHVVSTNEAHGLLVMYRSAMFMRTACGFAQKTSARIHERRCASLIYPPSVP